MQNRELKKATRPQAQPCRSRSDVVVDRFAPWPRHWTPSGRMASPPRSLAADAHGCIMVRIRDGIHRMQGFGATFAPEWRAPL
jgi:hypothetical protein